MARADSLGTSVRHDASNLRIVFLSRSPISCRSRMASCTEAEILLRYLLAILRHLEQPLLLHGLFDFLVIEAENHLRRVLQLSQLPHAEVLSIVLRETMDKDRPPTLPVGNDSPEPTGSTLPQACHALLYEAPAQLRIDQPVSARSIASRSSASSMPSLRAKRRK